MGEGGQDGVLMQDVTAISSDSIAANLQENIEAIKQLTGNSTDVVVREFKLGMIEDKSACMISIDGVIDSASVNNFILESLMLEGRTIARDYQSGEPILQYIKQYMLTAVTVDSDIGHYNQLFSSLLSGSAILLIDGCTSAISIEMSGWKERSISEPSSESVIRGPKEGFIENLRTNTAMIRKKIKSPNLWMETYKIGKITQTSVAVLYMNGIADENVLEELRTRLKRIDTDSILDSGYIEEFIQDEAITPFPTVYNSERPDAIAADLLEGKIAIVVDGSPFVLVVPALLVAFMHSAEDYYHRVDVSSFIRILRLIGIFVALLGPASYVAISTFHREMIPTALLISLAAQREGIPFPAVVEAMFMEVIFEILREASIRMPRNIGQAMSIVGSIVLGTLAVEASLASPAMVIVVSITAIANFVIPSNELGTAVRLLRFLFIIAAATFGVFGIILGIIVIALHLSSLRSFGVPYLSPFAPFSKQGQKDAAIRAPLRSMLFRPKLIARNNVFRRRIRR